MGRGVCPPHFPHTHGKAVSVVHRELPQIHWGRGQYFAHTFTSTLFSMSRELTLLLTS